MAGTAVHGLTTREARNEAFLVGGLLGLLVGISIGAWLVRA